MWSETVFFTSNFPTKDLRPNRLIVSSSDRTYLFVFLNNAFTELKRII